MLQKLSPNLITAIPAPFFDHPLQCQELPGAEISRDTHIRHDETNQENSLGKKSFGFGWMVMYDGMRLYRRRSGMGCAMKFWAVGYFPRKTLSFHQNGNDSHK